MKEKTNMSKCEKIILVLIVAALFGILFGLQEKNRIESMPSAVLLAIIK